MARLVLLTALTMTAFAANSLLNRAALAGGEIGPSAFAAIRVVTGALILIAIVCTKSRGWPRFTPPSPMAVGGLTLYLLGFSHAYVSLDAGPGALILFAGVQVTMFLGAVLAGEQVPQRRWSGMGLALIGLAVLTNPFSAQAVPIIAAVLMGAAALGWGLYSLVGRQVSDPLNATTWNFVCASPIVLLSLFLWPDSSVATGQGILLAVVSGAVTSGLGYALWYTILPALGATRAALAQLSVPVIALGLGALLLRELPPVSALIAALLILGGIVIGLNRAKRG